MWHPASMPLFRQWSGETKSQLLASNQTARPPRHRRREYARALALVASKAPRPEWVAFFGRCANEAYQEESSFHKASSPAGWERSCPAAATTCCVHNPWYGGAAWAGGQFRSRCMHTCSPCGIGVPPLGW